MLTPTRSSWVKRQRYQYKLRQEGKPSFLTDERVAVLDRLGFVWDSHSSVWEQRFHELQEFQRQFGHSNVPYNYKNPKLASWVKAQRREMRAFKEGKTISPEMFQRFLSLEKLDFCWQLRTSGRKNQSKEATKPQQINS
jgi:Helicase associated domain